VLAQKEGNIWVSGELAGINFNSDEALPFKQPYYNDIWRTNASICDSNGKLLFYTNGFRVFNRNYKIMPNGDDLNIGDYISFGYNELPIPNGAVIIPIPGSSTRYYVFQSDLDWIYDTITNGAFFPEKLQYSIVDMSLDNGKGDVDNDFKNIVILSDTLAQVGMEAVKNADDNGLWLICHEFNSNRYYRFLIDQHGIHGPFSQNIGLPLSEINAILFSEFRFSQDGSMAMQVNHDSTLFELYDFDRCTGELGNRRQIKVSDSAYNIEGESFSPNGRFAYFSANHWQYLFQFDLQSENIEQSKVLIAKYDGTLNPFQTNFYDHAIGPDGKIYICNYGYNSSLHVINSPDSQGLKCNFVQNQLQLDSGTYWGAGFPNLPNYQLSPLVGSTCDTLITYSPPIDQASFTYGVYPNPCNGKFQLSITGINNEVPVAIYNTMGELIYQTTLHEQNGFIHGFFNLQNEPAGIYLLKAETNRGEITAKIVKQ
jgi:hypothetical protein